MFIQSIYLAALLATRFVASTPVVGSGFKTIFEAVPEGTTDGDMIVTMKITTGDGEFFVGHPINLNSTTPSEVEEVDLDVTPNPLQKRCGSNSPQNCYGDNKAQLSACNVLLEVLNYDPHNVLPVWPRSKCAWNNIGNRCCSSWSHDSSDIARSYLVPALSKAIDYCLDGNGFLSGKTHDVDLGGVCLTQCTSNGPGGCNDN